MTRSHELPESHGGVLICGASGRAAAWSARRAALEPRAVDLFQDTDLRAICADSRRSIRYPHDLPSLLNEFPPGVPWMYTGGLENHPQLVDSITEARPLWGNSGSVLRRIRDPRLVCRALASAGLPVLQIRAADDPPPTNAGWLCKPVRSVAGRSISHWTSNAATFAPGARSREPVYFQQYCAGVPHAALFLAGWPEPNQARLLGVTRQLMASDVTDGRKAAFDSAVETDASPFTYAGSVGPVKLPEDTEAQLTASATALTASCGLRGLCGMDFVLDDSHSAWPVEINPRYPASAEVLELAFGLPLLRWHATCFADSDPGELPEPPPFRLDQQPRCHAGKVIVRTPAKVRVDRQLAIALEQRCVPALWPTGPAEAVFSTRVAPVVFTADIPQSGVLLTAGAPCCTLLVCGPSLPACRKALQVEAAALRQQLRLCAAARRE